MSNPSWVAEVGAIGGLIGSVTGISGTMMGFVNYRRIRILKALDLRIELRRAIVDLRIILRNLPDLLRKANSSRSAVLAARGLGRSGPMEVWQKTLDGDSDSIAALNEEFTEMDADTELSELSQEQLEEKLINIHRLRREADRLKDQYDADLAKDDKDREALSRHR